MAMIQRGEKPANIRDINDQPPNPNQPIPDSRVGPKPKVSFSFHFLLCLQYWDWHNLPFHSSRNFFQSQGTQGSGDGLNYDYQDNLTNGDSSTPWWQRKNASITEIEAENEQKFGSTASPTEVRPVQRSWVPPQPPPVAMPEAVAAIRQTKKPLFKKEKLADDELMARSSEISDDLQRITKISESGGLTEANGSSFGQQLSEAPITNGENVLSS